MVWTLDSCTWVRVMKLVKSSRETDHLLGDHDYSLDGELPVAVVEQVLQTGAEEVDDQDVVQTLLAEVVDIRDPGCNMLVEFACAFVGQAAGVQARQPCSDHGRNALSGRQQQTRALR